MNKVSLPASYYISQLKRPELDFQKMKAKLGEILMKNSQLIELETKQNPLTSLKKLAVSMECTAKQILLMFVRKFQHGEVQNNTVKFTYSYIARSLGVGYRTPSTRTMARHIERFMEMPFKFILDKERSTLKLPNQDTNCIAVRLHPSVIFFKDKKNQVAHEQGASISFNRKPMTPLPPRSYPTQASGINFEPNAYAKPKPSPEPARTATGMNVFGALASSYLQDLQNGFPSGNF